MKIEIIRYPNDDDWARCLFLARETQGKNDTAIPSLSWREKILAAEHSPVRTLMYTIGMWDIPYFASVHLVRHKFGVEHYVKSQRKNPERGAERQDALVNHVMDMNYMALVNMARKRLCYKADPVTRGIMELIRDELAKVDPITARFLVPDCEYRRGCHEMQPCGRYQEK